MFKSRVKKDQSFTDEELGLDDLEQVGPGGTFIDREHTVRHLRRQLWFPALLDREFYQAWKDAGAAASEERCRRRKEDILANHRPEPLPSDLDRAISAVVDAARRHLR